MRVALVTGMMSNSTAGNESLQSSYLEKMREYVFLSELLQVAWYSKGRVVEVLRADVDNAGYDLALQCGDTCRYIQLKSSRNDAKTSQQKANIKLADKPGGCIIWMLHDDTDRSVKLTYRIFGKGPNEKPDPGNRIGRHSKGNAAGRKAARPDIRVINKGAFSQPIAIEELFDKLFPETHPRKSCPAV